MQQWFEKLIVPHPLCMIKKHNLPQNAKAIIYCHCYSVQRSDSMLHWLRSTYKWLKIHFVPAGCTCIFQPCDVGLQCILKHQIHRSARFYLTIQVRNQIENGISPEKVDIRISLPLLRDTSAHWIMDATYHLNHSQQMKIPQNAWASCCVKNWKLSWDCLISGAAQGIFIAKDKAILYEVKGLNITTPDMKEEHMDDNVDCEDNVDIPMEMIFMAVS
ncbi:hypothetical protein BDD12DRAFT_750652 [Trichophaea hybrida]|nr:hypothetical protein BDD12DRAFT_750652 [Trichophaea hybrida]